MIKQNEYALLLLLHFVFRSYLSASVQLVRLLTGFLSLCIIYFTLDVSA
jgi:hypothetical protein